jgi:hypothetical protein
MKIEICCDSLHVLGWRWPSYEVVLPDGKTCIQPAPVFLPSPCRNSVYTHENVRLA